MGKSTRPKGFESIKPTFRILSLYTKTNSAEVQHMKHIMILILIMLTISPTTAECERDFSSVNNIKTTARTSMKQEALSSIVRTKVDSPDLKENNPTESIINWLNSGKGTRHIKRHICTGPRGPKA